jgi:hypothetical protein
MTFSAPPQQPKEATPKAQPEPSISIEPLKLQQESKGKSIVKSPRVGNQASPFRRPMNPAP